MLTITKKTDPEEEESGGIFGTRKSAGHEPARSVLMLDEEEEEEVKEVSESKRILITEMDGELSWFHQVFL